MVRRIRNKEEKEKEIALYVNPKSNGLTYENYRILKDKYGHYTLKIESVTGFDSDKYDTDWSKYFYSKPDLMNYLKRHRDSGMDDLYDQIDGTSD